MFMKVWLVFQFHTVSNTRAKANKIFNNIGAKSTIVNNCGVIQILSKMVIGIDNISV